MGVTHIEVQNTFNRSEQIYYWTSNLACFDGWFFFLVYLSALKDTLELLTPMFSSSAVIMGFQLYLFSVQFQFAILCEQMDGVAIGSPLSPAVTNIYMAGSSIWPRHTSTFQS